jgi:hypothetical protein
MRIRTRLRPRGASRFDGDPREFDKDAGRLEQAACRFEEQEAWEDAARAWREALDLDPRPAEWHFRLGRVLERHGNLIGATLAYREAIARDPTQPRWHFRLGQVLVATGEWTAARHAHKQARRLGPKRKPTVKGRRGKQLPFLSEIELGITRKPAYAYGLYRAAQAAERLGVDRISALELGVAGGRGLLALERHARNIEGMFGVRVDVYGLDTGQGLMAANDHRDLPYFFAEGNYAMDEAALRERLKRAELILGDASVTFADLFERGLAPIGFMSFDMDHYTPTAAVLGRCDGTAEHEGFLPRVALYFDDVVGNRGQDYNRFTGELLAIDEFNDRNSEVKIAEDRHFRCLPVNFQWHHCCYVMHRFKHPRYGDYVSKASPRSLRLK